MSRRRRDRPVRPNGVPAPRSGPSVGARGTRGTVPVPQDGRGIARTRLVGSIHGSVARTDGSVHVRSHTKRRSNHVYVNVLGPPRIVRHRRPKDRWTVPRRTLETRLERTAPVRRVVRCQRPPYVAHARSVPVRPVAAARCPCGIGLVVVVRRRHNVRLVRVEMPDDIARLLRSTARIDVRVHTVRGIHPNPSSVRVRQRRGFGSPGGRRTRAARGRDGPVFPVQRPMTLDVVVETRTRRSVVRSVTRT